MTQIRRAGCLVESLEINHPMPEIWHEDSRAEEISLGGHRLLAACHRAAYKALSGPRLSCWRVLRRRSIINHLRHNLRLRRLERCKSGIVCHEITSFL